MDGGETNQAALPREEWPVPVLDAVRRQPCVLIIAVAGVDVVVIPPTSAGYVIPPESDRVHDAAMGAARSVAEARRRGYQLEPGSV